VHGVDKRRSVVPDGQVGLDRLQLGVTALQHRPVVGIGRCQRGLIEALGEQPALMGQRPGIAASPGPAVAQQELAEAMASPGAVLDHVGPGAAQIPHCLLGHGRDADGHQFSGPVQPGQPPAVPPVGLDLVAGRLGDQRGGDHLAAHSHAMQQPGQLIAGRSGLIAGSQPAGIPKAANEPAHRRLLMRNPLDIRAVPIWGKDRHRDGVLVDVQAKVDQAKMGDTGHGRLLPYVAPSAPSWMTHALVTAERSRPLHAD
jgi:hypothetical protein